MAKLWQSVQNMEGVQKKPGKKISNEINNLGVYYLGDYANNAKLTPA